MQKRGRPRHPDVLTPREFDVLALVRERLTNEQIAGRLGVSADTAKYHVSEIITKLGVSDRREAAAWQRDGEEAHTRRWSAGLAPLLWAKRLPFAWLSKAAAGAVLTATAAGIALLAWGVMSTSSVAVTTTGCGAEQSTGSAPPCAPGLAQAGAGADAISAISAGASQTCALKNFAVWCWGDNASGLFVSGGTVGNPVPVPVSGLASGVTAISVGGGHSCAVKDGGAWCWGSVPDRWAAGGLDVCLYNDGYTCFGAPVPLSGLENGVSAISVGPWVFGGLQNTCAVKDGGVWCLDTNDFNHNGEYDAAAPVRGLASGVSAISAGDAHVCALKDGGVWCQGYNSTGQLGNGSLADSDAAVAVSGLTSGVSAISAGAARSCALKDGGVWCWGWNFHGQLGDGSQTDSAVPTAVPGLASGVGAISAGGDHTCALKDGGVWCWGSNINGELGNNSTAESHVPVAVSGLDSGVSAISAGQDHSCALKGEEIWCWGRNAAGQLGDPRGAGSIVPVPVSGLASGVSDVEGSCALTYGGVWCWGSNSGGDLGNNSTTDSPVPVPVSGLASGVSAISPGPCALKDDGLWCWGPNWFGQPNGGIPPNSLVPVAVSGLLGGVSAISGNCVLKDGGVFCQPISTSTTADTPLVAVPGFGSGVSAISAAGAEGQTCALKEGGVSCWAFGDAPVAEPGLASDVSAIIPTDWSFCAIKDGGAWCGGRNGGVVAVSGLGSGVSAISAAGDQTCVLKEGGVSCWGSQVEEPETLSLVPVPGLGSGVSAIGGTCALKEGGVLCWGDNSNGQLGNNTPPYSLVPVAVRFPPPSAGDIAEKPDAEPLPSRPSTDSADHRAAYALAGTAAAALAIVAAGMWAVWRRRRNS